MEEYNNLIKKIKCIYTYNNETKEDTYWEGYISIKNIDGILRIEGYEKDNMDSLEENGKPHFRYILGNKILSTSDDSLIFEIYPSKIPIIQYDVYYNKNDDCFYGKWHQLPIINRINNKPLLSRSGEAIIHIENTIIEEKEVMNTIKEVADRTRKEYPEKIERYETISQNFILLGNKKNYSQSVKKLARFSNSIKK